MHVQKAALRPGIDWKTTDELAKGNSYNKWICIEKLNIMTIIFSLKYDLKEKSKDTVT